jgi:hypothetical protein
LAIKKETQRRKAALNWLFHSGQEKGGGEQTKESGQGNGNRFPSFLYPHSSVLALSVNASRRPARAERAGASESNYPHRSIPHAGRGGGLLRRPAIFLIINQNLVPPTGRAAMSLPS